MPFSEPWRRYVPGDFFYGFSGARGKLVNKLTGKQQSHKMAVPIEGSTRVRLLYLDHLITASGAAIAPSLNSDFCTFCRNDARFKGVVKPNADEQVEIDEKKLWHDNKIWRRKSKAGIEFLVKHHHFIHFAIDKDMIWEQVATAPGVKAKQIETHFKKKITVMDNGNDTQVVDESSLLKSVVITYSELRFIYENRTDSDFQKRIQFWYQLDNSAHSSFEADVPPWEKFPDPWAKYVPESDYQ